MSWQEEVKYLENIWNKKGYWKSKPVKLVATEKVTRRLWMKLQYIQNKKVNYKLSIKIYNNILLFLIIVPWLCLSPEDRASQTEWDGLQPKKIVWTY